MFLDKGKKETNFMKNRHDVQIVEAKYIDKLIALKDFLIKLIEREKISDEDKIFFLSGINYKDNFKEDNTI